MYLGLKDGIVRITGSSSGVGRAVAIAFGAVGTRVAVTNHENRQGAEVTARQVEDAAAAVAFLSP